MKTTLEIQNLKCGGCAHTISSKLSKQSGIENILVNHEDNTVSFHYENDIILTETKQLLKNIGYPILGDKNALTTKAKSFVSCAVGKINK